jgi:hypothetical protein
MAARLCAHIPFLAVLAVRHPSLRTYGNRDALARHDALRRPRAVAAAFRHESAQPLLAIDDSFAFQLLISTLDRDEADE